MAAQPTTGPTTTGPTSSAPTTGPTSSSPTSSSPTSSSAPTTGPTSSSAPTTGAPTTGPATTGSAPDRRWRLLAGGDSLLRRRTSADPFARIRPRLNQANLTLVNLETAIATGGDAQDKSYVFRAEPRFASLLSQAGVDAVSLANNHAMDYGPEALLETLGHLRDNGVTPFGAGRDLTEALAPARFTVKGVRIAVIGASQIIPAPSWIATADRIGIASAGRHTIDANTDRLLTAVRTAAADNDVVIVFMHWGIEGDDCPSGVQIRLARMLRDAGAVAVIGAHPHVLQPIVADTGDAPDAGDGTRTWDTASEPGTAGADRRAPGVIAYSLGNFIWDPRSGRTADTGVLELGFDGGRLTDIVFHPHRLDANGWAAAVDDASSSARIRSAAARRCPGARGTDRWPTTRK